MLPMNLWMNSCEAHSYIARKLTGHEKSQDSLLLQGRMHAYIILLLSEIGTKKSGYVRLLLLQVAEHQIHKWRDRVL
jgi:hypothetical protein